MICLQHQPFRILHLAILRQLFLNFNSIRVDMILDPASWKLELTHDLRNVLVIFWQGLSTATHYINPRETIQCQQGLNHSYCNTLGQQNSRQEKASYQPFVVANQVNSNCGTAVRRPDFCNTFFQVDFANFWY